MMKDQRIHLHNKSPWQLHHTSIGIAIANAYEVSTLEEAGVVWMEEWWMEWVFNRRAAKECFIALSSFWWSSCLITHLANETGYITIYFALISIYLLCFRVNQHQTSSLGVDALTISMYTLLFKSLGSVGFYLFFLKLTKASFIWYSKK